MRARRRDLQRAAAEQPARARRPGHRPGRSLGPAAGDGWVDRRLLGLTSTRAASSSDADREQPQSVDDARLRRDWPQGTAARAGAPGRHRDRQQTAHRRARCRRARSRRRSRRRLRSRWGSAPEAARMPSAIGRSNAAPTLRTSAGARLTVMRRARKRKPGVANRGAHAIAALAHRRIRQPHHRHARADRRRRRRLRRRRESRRCRRAAAADKRASMRASMQQGRGPRGSRRTRSVCDT